MGRKQEMAEKDGDFAGSFERQRLRIGASRENQ